MMPINLPGQALTELCSICSAFGLKKEDFCGVFSNRGRSVDREDSYNPGYLIDIRTRAASCSLCQLIVRACEDCSMSSIKDERFYEVRLNWPFVPLHRQNATLPYTRSLIMSCLIWKLPPGEHVPIEEREVRINYISILDDDAPIPDTFDCGRLINPDYIDFGLLRYWTWLCRTLHGDTCEKMKRLRFEPQRASNWFWLIDVNQLCIVEGTDTSEWIALSYNWGAPPEKETSQGTFETLQKPGALADHENTMSRIIVYAIFCTRQLGYLYLWIDRLCINQNDPVLIEAAMVNMHMVYANAALTIVAATGINAAAGLPGVGKSSRDWTQPVAEIAPGFRLLTGRNPVHAIASSRYHSRAWTYQEYMLSNRRLIFYEGLTLFHCRTGTWHEDLRTESIFTAPSSGRLDLFSIIRPLMVESDVTSSVPFRDDPGLDNTFAAYNAVVYEITKRNLSFQSDVISACFSILNLVCGQMYSDIFFGLPVLLFDWAMLFRSDASEGLKRRQPFPSWSWTGWIGSVSIPSSPPHTIAEISCFMLDKRFLEWSYLDPWADAPVPLFSSQTPEFVSGVPSTRYRRYTANGAKFMQCEEVYNKPGLFKSININFTDRPLPSEPTLSSDQYQPSIFDRGILQTWGILAYFKLAAATKNFQPPNTDTCFLGKSRKSWSLFDTDNVWSGFFYPRESMDSAGSKIMKMPVLLHSVGTALNKEERDQRLQQYQGLIMKGQAADRVRYRDSSRDDTVREIVRSAKRVAPLKLYEAEEQESLTRLQSIIDRADYDFINVLGLMPHEDSLAFEVYGTGWVFGRAIQHALSPKPCWRRIILV